MVADVGVRKETMLAKSRTRWQGGGEQGEVSTELTGIEAKRGRDLTHAGSHALSDED